MAYTVFFSWQSDRSPQEGRNLIESAIKSAIQELGADAEIAESLRDSLSLDKDTKGVPGNPPIFETILKKIDQSAIFVPDLTSVEYFEADSESECSHRIRMGAQVARIPSDCASDECRSR